MISLFPIYDNEYISNLFNVHSGTVNKIRQGRLWTHLTGIDKNKVKSRREKLTQINVDEIRNRLNRGESTTYVASLFNISQGTVSKIKNRKIWK